MSAHFMRVCAPSPHYFDTDFLDGANKAVQTSFQIIFRQPAPAEPLQPLEPPVTPPPVEDAAEPVVGVSMSDAFESKLAEFYERAHKRSSDAGLRVVHRVSDVSTVSVDRHEAVFNARRDLKEAMAQMVRNDFMDLVGNAEPADVTDAHDDDHPLLDKLSQCLTGRVWVTVQCREVFYVEEAATGRLVQGSREPADAGALVTHQLVLECCLDTNKKRFLCDWRVVDIDDWLEGNEFLKTRDEGVDGDGTRD